uniref:Fork-head domain-containing protein n=1 Tax=Steinernema glaseri TaxID=37863 RepID=A0A1I8A3Q9_9BILA
MHRLPPLLQPVNPSMAHSLFPTNAFPPYFGFPIQLESSPLPKPQHSYIGLIAMAILSTPEQKMVLSEIYQWIVEQYPYFQRRGPGWRNSIRHNLSLNDCFIKAGRCANGKGHYWSIHPANLNDFKKGDFRRRRAQKKVRRHMGLAVDDVDSDSETVAPRLPVAVTTTPRRAFDVESLLKPEGSIFPGPFFNFASFGRIVPACDAETSH